MMTGHSHDYDIHQRNRMNDRDQNYNYADVNQHGHHHHHHGGHDKNHTADVKQKIYSGYNSQENKAEGTDYDNEVYQKNKLNDHDHNKNKAYVDQHGRHNDSDVTQKIYSGYNSQKNKATAQGEGDETPTEESVSAKGHGGHHGHDYEVYQSNYLNDRDYNKNKTDIDQKGKGNDADVKQIIGSGGNYQSNKADVEYDGHVRQKNHLNDHDHNKNKAYVDQHGKDNDAKVKQEIYSGYNEQKNKPVENGVGDDGKVRQSNWLNDRDNNKNTADIDQGGGKHKGKDAKSESENGDNGHHGHHKGGDNFAKANQYIGSGGNHQTNKADVHDDGHIGQRNGLNDHDHNKNKADIDQYGKSNEARVNQDIYSGYNSQKNEAENDDGRVRQKNWLNDRDNNKNKADIDQGGKHKGGDSETLNGKEGGSGHHGHHAKDNYANVKQIIGSGGNHQTNKATVDDDGRVGQRNKLNDHDHNENYADVDQRGKDNDARVKQEIYSGYNYQKNEASNDDEHIRQKNWLNDSDENSNHADIDQGGKHKKGSPDSVKSENGENGHHGHHKGGDHYARVKQEIVSGDNWQKNKATSDDDGDVRQKNDLNDHDHNNNHAEVSQYGHDNDAEVKQKIYSGYNEQVNKAELGDGDIDQTNYMDDHDNNDNYADVDQGKHKDAPWGNSKSENGDNGHHGSENHADVGQKIYSGYNDQTNYAKANYTEEVDQSNHLNDHDHNSNYAEVDQHGHDNDADVTQKIYSGGNYQSNKVEAYGENGDHDDYYDVHQVNLMYDQDHNTNNAHVHQGGYDHSADVVQVIDSGGNHQSNESLLDVA